MQHSTHKREEKKSIGFKGEHIITTANCTSDYAMKMIALINNNIQKRYTALKNGTMCLKLANELLAEYDTFVDQLNRRFKTQELYIENITCTVGRAAIADVMTGTGTYTGEVTHCAVGTGTAVPAEGDTQLATETYRKAISVGTPSSNIAILETFFEPGEATATLEEYGYFIDGTLTINTGQLCNRFTQQVTKSATESLNVRSLITLSDQ